MQITTLNTNNWNSLLERPTQSVADIENTVLQIFEEIRESGMEAVQKYTQQFDGVIVEDIAVSEEEFRISEAQVPQKLQRAIQQAKENITAFHRAQQTKRVSVETAKGVRCWQEKRAIENVGLYIPGGSAPLFSTVLMLAVPAAIAGCKEIVLCSPPDKNGRIAPEILYTAKLCGVTKIYKIGGIQAIGALTFGAGEVPKVAKIFGPGNQYVTVAKQLATQYGVSIDMPAGPSELLVVADDSANPAFVASDLLSQAEHGADSQVVLVSDSVTFVKEVINEIATQTQVLPRKEIVEAALKNARAILIDTVTTAMSFINDYAPEHLIISTRNDDFFVARIQNAGSVFIGKYTPESAGDYASGTNHTLPTNGYAKAYSGVNLDSFQKAITFQSITKEGLQNIGETIELMAAAEGLQAHKNAVSLRLKSMNNE